MVKRTYVPDAGDIVWVSFDPQSGHEQAGRRPGLVLSPSKYNAPSGFALTCPITSKVKGYPFEIRVSGKRIEGVVLADQLRSLDWQARDFTFIEQAEEVLLSDVRVTLARLLQLD